MKEVWQSLLSETTDGDIIENEFEQLTDRWEKLQAVIEEVDIKIKTLNEILPAYFSTANNCSDEFDAIERRLDVAVSLGVDLDEAEKEMTRVKVRIFCLSLFRLSNYLKTFFIFLEDSFDYGHDCQF